MLRRQGLLVGSRELTENLILWHRPNWALFSQKREKMISLCEVQPEDGKIMTGDFGQHNYISESLFYKQP